MALGLTKHLDREELADSARTGEIEQYLNWVPVHAGDAIFVPAGLLHTLGSASRFARLHRARTASRGNCTSKKARR
ncbi:MAG: hypothetical protein R2748_27900 [Bryobacterales bacterium]